MMTTTMVREQTEQVDVEGAAASIGEMQSEVARLEIQVAGLAAQEEPLTALVEAGMAAALADARTPGRTSATVRWFGCRDRLQELQSQRIVAERTLGTKKAALERLEGRHLPLIRLHEEAVSEAQAAFGEDARLLDAEITKLQASKASAGPTRLREIVTSLDTLTADRKQLQRRRAEYVATRYEHLIGKHISKIASDVKASAEATLTRAQQVLEGRGPMPGESAMVSATRSAHQAACRNILANPSRVYQEALADCEVQHGALIARRAATALKAEGVL
jgi:hypothetical protein